MAVPVSDYEWMHNNKPYTRNEFPFILSLASTIYTTQGKVVIGLGMAENCSGLTLVALSRVRKLRHQLLQPFSVERLKKINEAK